MSGGRVVHLTPFVHPPWTERSIRPDAGSRPCHRGSGPRSTQHKEATLREWLAHPEDPTALRGARAAASRWSEALDEAELAKTGYHSAVRRLHLAGGSLREIAEALEVSHQRVHQMIEGAGGTAGWKPRQRAGSDFACSFCGATKTEVTGLVAGPGVFICDGCVALCGQVIQDSRSVSEGRSHLDPVSPASAFTCSFCDRPASAVERLVAGPGVRICDQCVRFSAEVIAALAE